MYEPKADEYFLLACMKVKLRIISVKFSTSIICYFLKFLFNIPNTAD